MKLWIVKIKTFAKTSKIVRTREFVFENIKIKMTNVFMSIVVKHQCDLNFHIIKHIDNVKLQQLWKLCDLRNYEVIFKIMRAYLKTRKNELMIKKFVSIEFSHSYKRFVINMKIHNDFMKYNRIAVIKHNSITVASTKLKKKNRLKNELKNIDIEKFFAHDETNVLKFFFFSISFVCLLFCFRHFYSTKKFVFSFHELFIDSMIIALKFEVTNDWEIWKNRQNFLTSITSNENWNSFSFENRIQNKCENESLNVIIISQLHV